MEQFNAGNVHYINEDYELALEVSRRTGERSLWKFHPSFCAGLHSVSRTATRVYQGLGSPWYCSFEVEAISFGCAGMLSTFLRYSECPLYSSVVTEGLGERHKAGPRR